MEISLTPSPLRNQGESLLCYPTTWVFGFISLQSSLRLLGVVAAVEHVREEELVSAGLTLCLISETCYFPVHLFPTNPILLLHEINEVLRFEVWVLLVLTMVLAELVYLE